MVSYFGFSFLAIVLAIIVIVCALIYLLIQSKKKDNLSSSSKTSELSKSYYEKWQTAVVIIFGLLLCLTGYLLFSPAGGIYTETISLWEYWTNDVLRFFSFAASENVASGLTLRRILIWPCFVADAICIYAYIKLDKKTK